MEDQINYIEFKGGSLTGPGRIGPVSYSKSGATLHYNGRSFRSIKGGYKANYFDVKTGEEYWISGCKRAGDDTLYPGFIDIDEDVREKYWLDIRQQPDRVAEMSFRSEGKYSKRRPK